MVLIYMKIFILYEYYLVKKVLKLNNLNITLKPLIKGSEISKKFFSQSI